MFSSDAYRWSPDMAESVERDDPRSLDRIWDEIIHPDIGRPMHWDRQGRPITLRQWCDLTEGRPKTASQQRRARERYKRVAKDNVGPYYVSTVWIGLDHSFSFMGPPIIFESMVFSRKRAPWSWDENDDEVRDDLDGIQWRYATEAGALRGHYRLRKLVRQHWHRHNGPGRLAINGGRWSRAEIFYGGDDY